LLHLDEEIDFKTASINSFYGILIFSRNFLKIISNAEREINENFLLTALLKMFRTGKNSRQWNTFWKCPVAQQFLCKKIPYGYRQCLLQNAAIRYFYLTDTEEKEYALKYSIIVLKVPKEEIIHANFSVIRDLYDEKYISLCS
jgi:hypothetical protein